MKSASFTRHVPKTVGEAISMLARLAAEDGRVLAGGQSLVPMMALRMARPAHLIDINEVAGLDTIVNDNGRLAIGALVRHGAFHQPVTEGPLGRLLTVVADSIGNYPIRMRGTMCGSLAHADPGSEWCLTAATLDAELVVRNQDGERRIPSNLFFDGIMSTTLKEDELLVEIRFPILPMDTMFGFFEFSHRARDLALAASLVTYRLEEGRMRDARLGIGGAEPTPRRIAAAEVALNGRRPGSEAFRLAARTAAHAVEPMDDSQIGVEHRRDLVEAVVQRALEQSL
ncbi:FAD binding domain-containing protein [Bradyrhizobium sp. Arg237L]|uniref:FAD binding domain-containing protein n=1 Tax=Bradyrhizobium sp. Arg237L TaxID=3003352 RepID=UPI00249E7273|nr:FAD binding domain-containing protein [Bradyrhizobium sp. Arg237L]MDI4236496.1 FAD binding domain-containing protein [Bradyrhizobium sp. Arg237L]